MTDEQIACLDYFEQKLRSLMTGANVHEISNVLSNIVVLKELAEQKVELPELDVIYTRVAIQMEKIYGSRYKNNNGNKT